MIIIMCGRQVAAPTLIVHCALLIVHYYYVACCNIIIPRHTVSPVCFELLSPGGRPLIYFTGPLEGASAPHIKSGSLIINVSSKLAGPRVYSRVNFKITVKS